MFSNKDLQKLIAPLIVEQILLMLVGIADTVMISYAGEAGKRRARECQPDGLPAFFNRIFNICGNYGIVSFIL